MLTGGGSGWNYCAALVEVEQGDSGEFPGVEAELSRRLAGVLEQRGSVAAAAQGSGAGQSWWRRLLGFTAALCWMGEAQGGRGGLKEAPRILGGRARRDPGGDCGAAGA